MSYNKAEEFLSKEIFKGNQAANFMKSLDESVNLNLVKNSIGVNIFIMNLNFENSQNDVNIRKAIQRGINIFYSSQGGTPYSLVSNPLSNTYRN